MSGFFKIGDICIGQNLVVDTRYNGLECEVVDCLRMRSVYSASTGRPQGEMLTYRVQWVDGTITAVDHDKLRRRKPPTTGEQSIRALFDNPPVDRRQTSPEWMAEYDRFQRQMGVQP